MNSFTFIIDGVKLLELSNLSIAILTLITQIVVAICAVVAISNAERIYRKQKNIDIEKYQEQQKMDQLEAKKDEIINNLILLQSNFEKANFILKNMLRKARSIGVEEFVLNRTDEMKKDLDNITKELQNFSFYTRRRIGTLIEFHFPKNIDSLYKKLEIEIDFLSDDNLIFEYLKNIEKKSSNELEKIIKNLIIEIKKVDKLK